MDWLYLNATGCEWKNESGLQAWLPVTTLRIQRGLQTWPTSTTVSDSRHSDCRDQDPIVYSPPLITDYLMSLQKYSLVVWYRLLDLCPIQVKLRSFVFYSDVISFLSWFTKIPINTLFRWVWWLFDHLKCTMCKMVLMVTSWPYGIWVYYSSSVWLHSWKHLLSSIQVLITKYSH